MTHEETLKIFSIMKANYTNFFKGMSKNDANAMVALWEDMFSHEKAEIVFAAVKAYIATDTKGYPPNVGAVKEKILDICQPDEMTEQEAFNLIAKAASNANYCAKEEFEKLPKELQRLVGSPNRLREWALMDTQTFQTVVGSNVMRSYRAIAKSTKETQMLPPSVRQLIEQTTQGKLMLEESKISIEEENDRRNQIHKLMEG